MGAASRLRPATRKRGHGSGGTPRSRRATRDGEVVKVTYEVRDVTGDVVRLTEALSGRWWDRPQVEHGALRFLDPDTLAAFLQEAGFVIEEQFGDWHGGPLTDTSEEITTIARRN